MTAHTTTTGGPAATGSGAAPRDWWVIAGMTTAAASAAVASFAGLRGLATAAGWPARLAWLLPITIDAYAMTAARVWLAGTPGQPVARRFARANALGAIGASIAGNAAYHAIGAGLLAVTWPVVVLVGAVPATVLGLTAHLHALRSRAVPTRRPGSGRGSPESGPADRAEDGPDARPESRTVDRPESGTTNRLADGPPAHPGSGTQGQTESGTVGRPTDRPVPRPKSRTQDRPGSETEDRPRSGIHSGPRARPRSASRRRPRYRTEADLLAAAQDVDARYRQEHGRPITRDALRAALRISGPRATELRRLLAQPPDSASRAASPAPERPDADLPSAAPSPGPAATPPDSQPLLDQPPLDPDPAPTTGPAGPASAPPDDAQTAADRPPAEPPPHAEPTTSPPTR